MGLHRLLSQRALYSAVILDMVTWCFAFHLLVTVAALDADLAWVCCPRVGEHSHAGSLLLLLRSLNDSFFLCVHRILGYSEYSYAVQPVLSRRLATTY